MNKKYNFVYVTTNLINGKQYIGDHSTDNLEDGYLGSGKPYFINAIKKYGKENFKKEILNFFSSKKDAFDAQKELIEKYNTIAPRGYNISSTGGHGLSNVKLDENTKLKISKTLTGKKRKPCSEETKKKISLKNLGKKRSEETKKLLSEIQKGKTYAKGKKWSEESKEKIRKPKSEEHCINIGKSKKGQTSWAKGKTFSIEYKQKMSESHKGKKQSQETINKRCEKLRGKKRTEEQKQKMRGPRKNKNI